MPGIDLAIGKDMDGVSYMFTEAFIAYAYRRGLIRSADVPADPAWDFYLPLGLSEAQFTALMADGLRDGSLFRHGYAYPGAAAPWRRLYNAGARIHVVTNRACGLDPAIAAAATRGWLDDQGIPYHTVTVTADKTAVPVDVFLDDHLGNYDALTSAGTPAYLLNRPWNRCPGDTRRRVDSVSQFADLCLAQGFRSPRAAA